MKGLLLLLSICITVSSYAQKAITVSGKAQGTYYVIKYLSRDTVSLQPEIEGLFKQIDRSLSLYLPSSLISRFNKSGKVIMDDHMRTVIKKAQEVSRVTDGLFDITVKPLVDLWGFGVERHNNGKPTPEAIRRTLRHVGYQNLTLRSRYLLKKEPGVEIDCNGIAQGYTSDVIAKFLLSRGISNYLVDVGGELVALGNNEKGLPWSVGIERLEQGAGHQNLLMMTSGAVATSGNYRRFFDEGGTRFAHTINPRTGEAVHNNIITVTVTAPDAITADAYDNALILLGVEKGLDFIRDHPKLKLGALYIYKDADGQVREKYSEGFFEQR
ncbi:FAD:protein FMN transferase [Chitinophaga sp. GCM10012297]|uniref:FAD:protein FMN transferase n=1 Tax=Chitinophaga chungangae TaxID=2821488 RepID=A0ABS3Y954_9BACT|nr:FAD:protein FMN transferase [Chitinophaga chungangae]MBO9151204.1 FAD:protein FMN transferase [Chitinophaga chungangae]